MATQIFNSLCLDKSILYTVKEMKAKEKRKLKIYEIEHEDTMQMIKDATRISQLPQNITTSSLAGYLSGNSTIFKKVGKISSVELKNLTDLLLSGKKWDDPEIINELKHLSIKFFATQPEIAFKLLHEKFSNLPKTFYLVEEINASKKKTSRIYR